MKSEPLTKSMKRELKAIKKLYPLGWIPKGNWRFMKGGVIYDLSAADLNKLHLIEAKELFVVKPRPRFFQD